jgi:hypothetical protein
MQSVPITTDVVSSNLIRARCTTLCDKVCQWFSLGPRVSSANKTDCHDKAEITNKQKHNLLHFVLKLLIYIYIYIWFRYMLHIINGLIN